MSAAERLRDGLARLEGEELEMLLLDAAAMDTESREAMQRDNGVPFLARTQRLLDLCLRAPALYPALYLFLVGDTGPDCFESFPDGELQLGTELLTRSREGYASTYRVRAVNSAHLNMYCRELRRRHATHPRFHAVEALMMAKGPGREEATLRGLCDQLAYEEGDARALTGVSTLVRYWLRAMHPTRAARLLLANEPRYRSVSDRYAHFLEEFLPRETSATGAAAWLRTQDQLQLHVVATLTDEHPYGPPMDDA